MAVDVINPWLWHSYPCWFLPVWRVASQPATRQPASLLAACGATWLLERVLAVWLAGCVRLQTVRIENEREVK
jgi:hypothetical protein